MTGCPERFAGPALRSAIILTLGTPGGIDRQMEYFTSLASTALPDWSLTTFETHVSRLHSIVTLPWKLLHFTAKCVARRFTLCHVNLAPRGSTLRKAIYCAICDALRIPYVLHLHGSNYHEFFAAGGRFRKSLIRRLFSHAATVIVLGRVWRDFVRDEIGINEQKIAIVPNAVPGPVIFEPSSRLDPPIILFLGVVGWRKGVDVLLEALAAPDVMAQKWTAVLAGDGEVNEYKVLATKLGLAGRVTFRGWCDDKDVSGLLRSSTILVLPSRAENLPLSLLEGMAHGLCPIVTPVGAVAEVISDDMNGLLVPVGDVAALAYALADVLSSPDKCGRLAEAARTSHSEKYDARQYPQRLAEIYRAVAERQSARHAREDDSDVDPRRQETVPRKTVPEGLGSVSLVQQGPAAS
jgi:glycosyltransferase involved in cell wall biosynthesis